MKFEAEIGHAEEIMAVTTNVMQQVSSISTQGDHELANAVDRIKDLTQAFTNMQDASKEHHQVMDEIVQNTNNITNQVNSSKLISTALTDLAAAVQKAVMTVVAEISKFRTD